MADKIKIVLVDDEADLCAVVKTNLEETGEFEVVTNTEAQKTVELVTREQPDLILLDVVMPGLRGDEIVSRLKDNEQTKAVPIVIVSGKGEMVYLKNKDQFKWLPNVAATIKPGELPDGRSAEALAKAYGANDYVSKPFSTELLIDVIHDVLKKAKKRSGGETQEG